MGTGENAAEMNAEILKQKPADVQLSAIAANNLLAHERFELFFVFLFKSLKILIHVFFAKNLILPHCSIVSGTTFVRFSEENEGLHGKRSTKQIEHVPKGNRDPERGDNADVV